MKETDSKFGVYNPSASEFINDSGKVIKILSEILQDRAEGIMFSPFDFRVNPTQEDDCIKQDPFFFQFSLRIS